MIATLHRLAITERLRVLLIGFGLALFMLLMVVVFDQAGVSSFKSTNEVESMSRGFDIRSFADPDLMFANLIGVAYAHPLFLAMMGSICIGLGARSCAGELRDGTLELTLARPISRRAYLSGYVAFIIIAALILLSIAAVSIPLGIKFVGMQINIGASALAATTFTTWMLYVSIGGLSMLFSVLASSRGQAMLMGIAALVATYFIEFFSRLWSTIESVGYLSPFHYYSPTDTLIGSGIDWGDVAVLSALSLVTYGWALIQFKRRDLA